VEALLSEQDDFRDHGFSWASSSSHSHPAEGSGVSAAGSLN
jgi:hypothetical protein